MLIRPICLPRLLLAQFRHCGGIRSYTPWKSSESSVASNGILLKLRRSRETRRTVRDPIHQLARVDNVKNRPSGITSPTSVSRHPLAYHHNSTLETATSPPCHWLCAALKIFASGSKVKALDFIQAPRASRLLPGWSVVSLPAFTTNDVHHIPLLLVF